MRSNYLNIALVAGILAGALFQPVPGFSGSNPSFQTKVLTSPVKIEVAASDAVSSAFANSLHIGTKSTWKLISVESDKAGTRHSRYQQYLDGFLIDNAIIILHETKQSGSNITGTFTDITNTPSNSIDKSRIRHTIENKLALTGSKLVNPVAEDNFRWIAESGSLHLVCMVDYFPSNSLEAHRLLIDANTLEIVGDFEHSCHANVQGTATTQYQGTQNLDCFLDAGTYTLKTTLKGNGIFTRNLNFQLNYQHVTEFTDNDNNWEQASLPADQYATDAHYCAGKYYDFLNTTFGRNSIDNNGYQLVSYLNYGTSFSNAFWNGQAVVYGSGNATTDPLTTIDIAGHEFTHGLIQKTANLSYSGEPGTINEAIADIFGVALEFYNDPQQANWTIAEQSGTILRSFSDPVAYNQPASYHGTNWYYGTGDQGGVHFNSGFINKWFYLVAHGEQGINEFGYNYSVDGIGVQHATEILYHTLIAYLVPASGFDDFRSLTLQSAIDIYGNCSPEYNAVLKAWNAVGLGNSDSNPQILTSTNFQFCTGDSLLVNVENIPGTTYTWYHNGNIVDSGTASEKFITSAGNWKVSASRCSENYISDEIFIGQFPAISVSTSNEITCAGVAVTLVASPAGGTFSVPNPYLGPSTNFTYRFIDGNNCEYEVAGNVLTHDVTQIHIMNEIDAYPVNHPPVLLTTDIQGTLYGTGVNGNYFYPDVAGENSTPVIYATTTDSNGCISKDSLTIEILTPCIKDHETISIEASSELVIPGDQVSFKVNASSDDFKFQWELSDNNVALGSLNENHLDVKWGNQEGTVTLLMINTCNDTIRKEYNLKLAAEVPSSHLSLFPNPATNFVNVTLSGPVSDNGYQVNITDQSGRLVFSMQVTTSATLIPLNNVKPGIYVVEILSNKKFFREKLVVN